MPVYKNMLYLIVYKEVIERIFSGEKVIEYRECTKYWKKRIENKEYRFCKISNGYGNATRPYLIMEYELIGIVERDNKPHYAIKCDKSKWIEFRKELNGAIEYDWNGTHYNRVINVILGNRNIVNGESST